MKGLFSSNHSRQNAAMAKVTMQKILIIIVITFELKLNLIIITLIQEYITQSSTSRLNMNTSFYDYYEKQRYILPEQLIPALADKQLTDISCGLCGGIVYSPIQCNKCQKMYCNTHRHRLNKCFVCNNIGFKDTQNVSKSHIRKLIDLKIKCTCTSQLFRYTEYVCHLKKCQEMIRNNNHSFKQFAFVRANGQKVRLSQKDNAMVNLNLKHKQDGFFINDIYYDLKAMVRSYFVMEKSKHVVEKLEYDISKTHGLRPYWTANLEKNHYFLYEEETQHRIEQAYIRNLESTEIKIDGETYTIKLNSKPMYQLKNKTGFTRVVDRTEV